MKYFSFLFFLFLQITTSAQDYYFPPTTGNEWETISPSDLDWCAEKIDSLNQFLAEKNTKAFIVLKEGKIAMEQYFDDFTQDSVWYWASAGKSLTAFLVGMAQEEGILNIEDPTATYLGEGWTVCTADQEAAINIRHQMTMTTGLDEGDILNGNCLDSDCLEYLTDPEERWYYYNAPFRLLHDVVANASGVSFNQYAFSRLNSIGLTGIWVNRVFYSKPRKAARFGLLMLNNGVWDGTAILENQDYFQHMVNTSQDLNPSYGYLWWLNGKGAFRLPQSELLFNSDLIPSAPDDLYAALGKNDQKIYVVPSQDLVVVRMGDNAEEGLFALTTFDNDLWIKLNEVFCNATPTEEVNAVTAIQIFPNPVGNRLFIQSSTATITNVNVYNAVGKLVLTSALTNEALQVDFLEKGIYFVEVQDEDGVRMKMEKVVKW